MEPDQKKKKRNSPKLGLGRGFVCLSKRIKKKKIQPRNLKSTGQMSESSEERGVIQRKCPKEKSEIDLLV